MIIIETGKLAQRPRRYAGELPESVLEFEPEQLIQACGPLRYDLMAQMVTGELLVRGIVAADFRLCCGRCGKFFALTLRDNKFLRSYALASENQLIDLTPDLREAILLALPINVLCAEDCKGLCAQCGANLNEGACACRREKAAGAWSALDQLNFKKSKSASASRVRARRLDRRL